MSPPLRSLPCALFVVLRALVTVPRITLSDLPFNLGRIGIQQVFNNGELRHRICIWIYVCARIVFTIAVGRARARSGQVRTNLDSGG